MLVRPRVALNRSIKRMSDIGIAAVLIVLSAPLMLVLALVVRLDSSGPVLERHTRIGPSGRRFCTLKFRTTEYDQQKHAWKAKLTVIGELLRYTRLDCLPQLINVLRGEMTILGADDITPFFLE